MRKILFVVLFLLLGVHGKAQVGRTGLSFLKLGVGGRALGMGEAHTAVATDPAATYYNPAGLSLSKTSQILLMHKEWFQDTKTEFIGAKISFESFALGFSVNTTSINNIEVRTTPGPAEATFNARNASIGLSAAYDLDPAFSVGFTGRYLYEKILIDDASGFGIDIGGIYKTPWDVRLGIAISNLGSMSELRAEASKLPTTIRLGGSTERQIESVDGTLTVAGDVVTITGEEKTHVHVGAELTFSHTFAVRAGYQAGYEAKNLSAGVGIKYGQFGVDYAFVPLRYDLGTTHTFSLLIEFH